MSASEIHALMMLLDDPDEGVYSHVRSQLLAQGPGILPMLKAQQATPMQCDVHAGRLEELLSGLMEEQARQGLKDWMATVDRPLLQGVAWLEMVLDFEGDAAESEQRFATLRRDVWLELNEELTALEQIRVMNHVLFTEYGFARAELSEQQLRHAMPSVVLAERKGAPLGLGILYLALAQSLNLPMHALSVSGLFLLAYVDPKWDGTGEAPPVWFYVNPFAGGEILSPEDVELIAEGLESGWTRAFLDAKSICTRLIHYVVRHCQDDEERLAAARLERLKADLT